MSNIKENWEFVKTLDVDDTWSLHLSHNDADGIACFVISEMAGYEFEYRECEAGNALNYLLELMIFEGYVPGEILITDLSFNETEDEIIIFDEFMKFFVKEKMVCFNLFDHHKTAIWMAERYPNCCKVKVEDGVSAAMLYLKETKHTRIMNRKWKDNVEEYVRRVSYYDTWFWKTLQDEPGIYEEEMILCSRYSRKYYIKHTVSKISSFLPYQSTEFDLSIIKRYRKDRKNSLAKAVDDISTINVFDYKVDVVVGTINASSLMEMWGKDHPDAICGVLYPHTRVLSLRTQREDIDVGGICKQLGGGGHPKAAGAVLEPELFCKLLQEYYGVSCS